MFENYSSIKKISAEEAFVTKGTTGQFTIFFYEGEQGRFYVTHFVVETPFKASNFMDFLELAMKNSHKVNELEMESNTIASSLIIFEFKKRALTIPDLNMFEMGEENMKKSIELFPHIKPSGVVAVSENNKSYSRFNTSIKHFKKDMNVFACDNIKCAENYILGQIGFSN